MNPFIKMTFAAGALLMPVFLLAQDAPTTPTATDSTDTSTSNTEEKPDISSVKNTADNLLRNGDFSQGKSGWNSTGSVVDVGDHKALEIRLRFSDLQSVSTKVRFGQSKRNLEVQFDVQGSDDMQLRTSPAINAWFEELNTITYCSVKIEAGKTKTVRFFYHVLSPDAREIPLHFDIAQGTGEIYLSNVIIVGSK